jgi:hypothetical protein
MPSTDHRFYRKRNAPEPERRKSTLTIPEHAHPATVLIYTLLCDRNVRVWQVCERAGVLQSTIKGLRTKNTPSLSTLDCLLGALRYSLVPTPYADDLPAGLREDLAPLAKKHGKSLETLTAYLIEAAALTRELSADGAERVRRHAERQRAAKAASRSFLPRPRAASAPLSERVS